MSRLSRYRPGSLVSHLIVLALLPAFDLPGSAGVDDQPERRAIVAGVDTVIVPGARTYLEPNYPNPVDKEYTVIAFSLAEQMPVTLRIYDYFYNEVAVIIDDEMMGPGRIVRAINFSRDVNVTPLFSGMYFYELRAGGETHVRRMLVIK